MIRAEDRLEESISCPTTVSKECSRKRDTVFVVSQVVSKRRSNAPLSLDLYFHIKENMLGRSTPNLMIVPLSLVVNVAYKLKVPHWRDKNELPNS